MNFHKKKYIFLSVSSRSGAGLAGAMLNAHSKVSFSTDQIKFFAFIKQRFPKISNKNINHILNEFKLRLEIRFDINFDTNYCLALIGKDFSIPNLYQAFFETIYKMDKDSFVLGECENMSWKNIPFFVKKIPNSKAFSIIRDPRDVIYSFKKNTIAKGNDYLINIFNNKGLMKSSINYQTKYVDNFYIIQFEKLKKNPEKVMKSICQFIDIEFEEQMLNEKYWMELNGIGWRKWGNKKVSSFDGQEKVHNPVGRWRGKIDHVDHFITEWILKKEMTKLGYNLEFENYSDEIFEEAILRLTSSKLLIQAFSNFLLKDIGSTELPLDRFNPNLWSQKTIIKKNKIKSLAKLMGY